jgi:hypothetical protein
LKLRQHSAHRRNPIIKAANKGKGKVLFFIIKGKIEWANYFFEVPKI